MARSADPSEMSGGVGGGSPSLAGSPTPSGTAARATEAVQLRKRDPLARAPTPQKARAALGSGRRLPSDLSQRMSAAFGRPFGDVRVHPENAGAGSMGARAFAVGKDIAFAPGEYQPGTPGGDRLIAHELAHVVQQAEGAEAVQKASPAGDLHETEAEQAAVRAASGRSVGTLTPAIARSVQRADPPPGADAAPTVTLVGTTFSPDADLSAQIDAAGAKGKPVLLSVPNVGSGAAKAFVRKKGDEKIYYLRPTKGSTIVVPITAGKLAALGDVDLHLKPKWGDPEVTGFVAPAGQSHAAAMNRFLKGAGALVGGVGIGPLKIPTVTNEFTADGPSVGVSNAGLDFGGVLSGQATFTLSPTRHTFELTIAIPAKQIKGLSADGRITVRRDEGGKLSGGGQVQASIGPVGGGVDVQWMPEGYVNLSGTLSLDYKGFTGSVTIVWADEATAQQVKEQAISTDRLRETATPIGSESEGGKKGPVKRALAGYGTVSAQLTDWFAATVLVAVAPSSRGYDVYVKGEYAPPKEIIFGGTKKEWTRDLFKVEARAAYGVPVIGNVFVYVSAALMGIAGVGPLKIYNIRLVGTWSTDPAVMKDVALSASLNFPLFALLRLRVEGGVGIEILAHDIKAGVGVNADAGVKGYIEATPTIGIREKPSGKPDFFLSGHLELAAQPFLALSGDLFVKLDSPWWSPAPDKTWSWPLGSLEYPLPGEFGIGADVEYVLGQKDLPKIEVGEVDFDASKFQADLMADKVPGKSGGGKKEKAGSWSNGKSGKGPPGKGKGKGGSSGQDDGSLNLPPEAWFFGPIGEKLSVDGGDESHTLSIDDKAGNATVVLASTPMPIERQVARMREKDDALEPNELKAVQALAPKITQAAKGIDSKADQIAILKEATKGNKAAVKKAGGKGKGKGGKKKQSAQAANNVVKQEQRKLVGLLRSFYKQYKGLQPINGSDIKVPPAAPIADKVAVVTAPGGSKKRQPELHVGGKKDGTRLRDLIKGNRPLGKEKLNAGKPRTASAAQQLDKAGGQVRKLRLYKRHKDRLTKAAQASSKTLSSWGRDLKVVKIQRAGEKKRLPKVRIALFEWKASGNKAYQAQFIKELRRQLRNQAKGINKLTVDEWIFNITKFALRPEHFMKLDRMGRAEVLKYATERARKSQAHWKARSPRLKATWDLLKQAQSDPTVLSSLNSKDAKRVEVRLKARGWTIAQILKLAKKHKGSAASVLARTAQDVAEERAEASKKIGRGTRAVTAAEKLADPNVTEEQVESLRKTIRIGKGSGREFGETQAERRQEVRDDPKIRQQMHKAIKEAAGEWGLLVGDATDFETVFSKLAVLHNPDQVAGGHGAIPELPPLPGPAATEKEWKAFRDKLKMMFGPQVVNKAIGENWLKHITQLSRSTAKDVGTRYARAIWMPNVKLEAQAM